MAACYQREIPKARVNITLDLETGGAKQQKELPLKLLMVGNFSQGAANSSLSQRERININKNNFNQVMSNVLPTLNIVAPNLIKNDGSEMSINMCFSNMKDFSPEKIVNKIPELKYLLAMRHLLRDLKSNLLDNHSLRRALDNIICDKTDLNQFSKELKALSVSA